MVPVSGLAIVLGGLLLLAVVLRTPTPPPATPATSAPLVIPPFPTLVLIQEVPTPTRVPTAIPTVNPVIAAWTPTPTPTICPATPSALPAGAVCEWAYATAVATEFPICRTPIPGDTCQIGPEGGRDATPIESATPVPLGQ